MNITQLRAFVTVVEAGSFSEAARQMGLSQPAVTMQIQGLETDLGVTLMERRYRKVELTESGRALLPHAKTVLADLERARDEIDRLSVTVSGHLVIASSTTPGQYVLPRLLGGYLRAYPEVTVSLEVSDTTMVVDYVESGQAQFGMTGAKLPGARVLYEAMGTDRLVMVAPPDSPLADKKGLQIADVADQPFITRESGSGTRIVFEESLRAAGVDPAELHVVMELGTSEAIISAIEGGMGIGVVSHWMADKALKLGTVRELQVPGFPVERPFYAVMPRGELTRAAEALLGHLRLGL
jgi:DNA-binding transcriptional LysR family regulator